MPASQPSRSLAPSGALHNYQEPIVTTAPWTYYDYGDYYFFEVQWNPYDASHYDSGGGAGASYDPIPDPNAADCSVDSTVVPIVPVSDLPPLSDESVQDYDCLKVQCPAALTVLNNASVVAASTTMLRAMQDDPNHVERGAWIMMDAAGNISTGTVGADGVVAVGDYYVGTNDCAYGLSCVKQLSSEPSNVSGYSIIGSVHTHPYEASQSGLDQNNAMLNHDYSIVATRKNLFMLDFNGTPLYQCPRQAWGSCTAP